MIFAMTFTHILIRISCDCRGKFVMAGIDFELNCESFPIGIPKNILDLSYKPTWSMLVKLWNNTCTTFHCYLSMSLHLTWYGKCGKRSFFCALSYKWLNMSSSASKEMAAASFQGSNGNLKKRLLEDGVKESTVLDVCQGCMFKERRR